MTTTEPAGSPGAQEPRSAAQKMEADAALAGLAAVEAIRVTDVAAVVLLGLLLCPPLAILAVVVVAPVVVMALALGLLAAVLSVPYLLVRPLRGHSEIHRALLTHRLRSAGRALLDLAPHRIVADARGVHARR